MKISAMSPGHFYCFDETRYGVFVAVRDVPNFYSWKKGHVVVVMHEWRVVPSYTSDGDPIPRSEHVADFGTTEIVPAKVERCIAGDLETGKTFLWDRFMHQQDASSRREGLRAEGEELKTRLDAQLERLGIGGWSTPNVERDDSITVNVHLYGAEKVVRLIEILERSREPR